jgi:hypothetical protein
LSIPDKDGVTEREHLKQVELQIGKTPLALQGPNFPTELEYIWSYFLELSATRSQGYSGPLPITYQEIMAWRDLTNNIVNAWEVEVIKRLDRIYIKVVNNGRS